MPRRSKPVPAGICGDCGEYLPHACAGIVRLPERLPPVSRRRALMNRAILRAAVTTQKRSAA